MAKLTTEEKNKKFEEKYVNGKTCPLCGYHFPLERFRFKKESNYLSQCVDCNKLVSTVATNIRKIKKDKNYLHSRMEEVQKMIQILTLINDFPKASSFEIVKLLNGSIMANDIKDKQKC